MGTGMEYFMGCRLGEGGFNCNGWRRKRCHALSPRPPSCYNLPMPYEWTPERTNRLKILWREGVSSRDIAYKIGGDLTRNAVIGKANRLGLSGGFGDGAKTQALKKTPVAPKAPIRRKCQWPFGHPDEPDFHFCEKPTFQTRPYCRDHCIEAYRRAVIPKTVPTG